MADTKLTVAIMAGGKSSRMGQDKSFVLFQGQPLVERVRDRVAGLGDELILITNQPEAYAHLKLPMYEDIVPDCGPLGGIYTAVSQAAHAHTLVVACDMPWLNEGLLGYMRQLRDVADVVVPRWERFPEPLHAIYSNACLDPIAARLEGRQLKVTGFFEQVRVRFVEREEMARFDPDCRSFANVNTPDQLASWE